HSATDTLSSSRSVRPSATRPWESTRTTPVRAWSSVAPPRIMARRIIRYADAGRPGAQDHDPLRRDRALEVTQRRQDAPDDDRGPTLDVVIEGRDAFAVAVEDPQRVGLLEVLPLDHAAGPHVRNGVDEFLDQAVIFDATQAWMPPPDVQGIAEQMLVVRPD